ncbi:ParA family protein [Methylobacterium sp. J-078]|uniref:ParA family protein n=1 Tax=Methylobacterium sp. J-078 TaxID=2836657 RepID=UPI001FBC146B|nr:ParA family protein [Methylobacterium sp. J-078]MCJ2043482.1 ParA family protein [Methylobacterium sp. J-078]
MIVISVVQQKGGVGKTTLTVNLAGELKSRGSRVVVIDADPQGSAVAWSAPRKLGFEVLPQILDTGKLAPWIRSVLKQSADYVIIDTPSGLGPVFDAAIDISDLIIVPCGPSSLDLNAARVTFTRIADALRKDPGLKVRVVTVPTRVEAQTPEGQHIASELEGFGEVVGPPLSHDPYFVRAFTQGVSVRTAAPASNAAGEIRGLTDFLLERLRAS